jgi:flagellar basal-body rod protein FlgG
MLYRALHTAGSGMDAFIFNLDVIANNMANAGTTGFKRSRTNFEDMYYQYYQPPGAANSQGGVVPEGIFAGTGARVSAVQPDFTQGSLVQSNRQLDVAIEGKGFFYVTDSEGNNHYTRNGQLALSNTGSLVIATANRNLLMNPQITIPPEATEISIAYDGTVSYLAPGNTSFQTAGQLQLYNFINPEGLLHQGENLYAETDASGTPLTGTPGGQEGLGFVRQNFLEASNTEPVRELIDLIKTQRNVELNSQIVQASDQLLQLVSNLRRF